MYKPGDIVAVYGEVRGGGHLINDNHDYYDIDDKTHSEPVFCKVIAVGFGGKNLKVYSPKTKLECIVSAMQVRLATRDGNKIVPKKSMYSASIFHHNYGTFVSHKKTFESLDDVRHEINLARDWAEKSEYSVDDVEFNVRKFIDITDEIE